MHWPYKQLKTSRNKKLLPFHNDLKNNGACFGQVAGFERPMWYALNGKKPEYEYSYGYQNWYESAKYETINTRKNVGLFDLSAFAKFEIKGDSALNDLQRLCCNDIKKDPGKTTYTQMLNSNGGIVADLTVTCIDEKFFRIVTGSSVREHDKKHIKENLSKNTTLTDVTDDLACLGVFGPRSRELLTKIFGDYFSTNDFKFGTAREIKFNNSNLFFQRLSFVFLECF